MINKKSAKDIAFDKERAKLKHQINEAQHDIRILSKTIEKLSEDISTLEKDNERLSMENNTLRSALDIPVEDLKLLIDDARRRLECRELLAFTSEAYKNITDEEKIIFSLAKLI